MKETDERNLKILAKCLLSLYLYLYTFTKYYYWFEAYHHEIKWKRVGGERNEKRLIAMSST